MAHLTKAPVYEIENSNIALLGSDLEKCVREHAGDIEPAWSGSGTTPGLQIWRIESFQVVEWPKKNYGQFYDGDSYIILHTYKKDPDADILSYDLHFWLGKDTTQDEAGTAAYKTVELDDHLGGRPVQYREAQGYESERFLSYFHRFLCLHGGVATGFHHVSEPPPLDIRKLYRVSLSHGSSRNVIIREIPFSAESLVDKDVFVLDKGDKIWQFITTGSAGMEKFKAAEFVQGIVNERQGQCDVTVYGEGGHGAGIFLSEFGLESTRISRKSDESNSAKATVAMFRVSDSTGQVEFDEVKPPSLASLSSDDAFLLDASDTFSPAVYVWLGKNSSLTERRLAIQYAQSYLYRKSGISRNRRVLATPVIRMAEGEEISEFFQALGA